MTVTSFTQGATLLLVLTGPVLAQEQPVSVEPAAATERLDSRPMFKSGEDAWKKTCAACHSGTEHAVGPDLIELEHDADTLKYFARNGYGPMPAFTESMIDDATMDAITSYVTEQYAGEDQ